MLSLLIITFMKIYFDTFGKRFPPPPKKKQAYHVRLGTQCWKHLKGTSCVYNLLPSVVSFCYIKKKKKFCCLFCHLKCKNWLSNLMGFFFFFGQLRPGLSLLMCFSSPEMYKNHCCCCQVASVVSDSVWPHRRQPTRLPRPWESPGKNTGVGCHFLLQCMKVKGESEVDQSHPTLSDPMDCSLPGSSVHGI